MWGRSIPSNYSGKSQDSRNLPNPTKDYRFVELLKKDQLVNDPCEVGDDDTSVVGMQLFIMGVVYRVSTCVFMHARPSVAPSSQRELWSPMDCINKFIHTEKAFWRVLVFSNMYLPHGYYNSW